MKRIVEERPKPPTFVRRDYPPELELIVLKTLEKNPDDRYQSATELHNDLQGFLARSNAHLRSHFHMADYVAKIFSEEADALISDAGRRRAQEFVDNADVSDGDRDDLDFDSGPTEGPGAALARALRAGTLGEWAESGHASATEAVNASDAGAAGESVDVDVPKASGPTGGSGSEVAVTGVAQGVRSAKSTSETDAKKSSAVARRSGQREATRGEGTAAPTAAPEGRWLTVIIAIVALVAAAAGTLWFLQGQ